jgi:glycerol-3-phosphate acyltransferase PlsY
LGSGNIGATNIARSLGFGTGLLVFALDAGKGAAGVFVGGKFSDGEWGALAAAVGAILGHMFSLFIRFRGGKAVATSLGVLLVISWQAGLLAFATWLVTLTVCRYVSVASTAAAIAVPILIKIFGGSGAYVVFGVLVCIAVLLKHIPNYQRLVAGTEPMFHLVRRGTRASGVAE